MSITDIGLQNIFRPEFNALEFSLMGMALVFGGLLIIALYILILPRLLQPRTPAKTKDITKAGKTDSREEEEILLAVATALHLHNNFPDGDERITWKSHGDMESPWLVSGRMHSLRNRNVPNRWNL